MSIDTAERSLLDAVAVHVQELRPELLEVSHRIHRRPETRFKEHFASGLLADALRRHGFAVRRPVAGLETAFVGEFGPGGGPTVAIFLEYDALEGLGHGCGHNVIGAAGLGAAVAVARWLAGHPGVPGRVLAIGSPAEEGGGGKVHLVDYGVLAGVDAALMVHPAGEDRVHRPHLAREALDLVFTGRPAHASVHPHLGRNALDAATLTLNAIAMLRQQVRPDSRIHAVVADGGQAPNIIPERAALHTFVRSPDTGYLADRLVPAVRNCARGAALATGTEVEIASPIPPYAALRTHTVLAKLIEHNMRLLGREPRTDEPEGGGSTDMGNVSQVVPAAHPLLQLVPDLVMHSHEAAAAAGDEPGDRVVLDGATTLAATTVQLIAHPDLLRTADRVAR